MPEINAQIDRLVRHISAGAEPYEKATLAEAFSDLGAGI